MLLGISSFYRELFEELIRTRDRLQIRMNATVNLQMFQRWYPVGSDPVGAKVASRLIGVE